MRQLIDDGEISAAGCDIAAIGGDRDLDFACIGARTANVKWYEHVFGSVTPKGDQVSIAARRELQGEGVDAIAPQCRSGAVVEDVA